MRHGSRRSRLGHEDHSFRSTGLTGSAARLVALRMCPRQVHPPPHAPHTACLFVIRWDTTIGLISAGCVHSAATVHIRRPFLEWHFCARSTAMYPCIWLSLQPDWRWRPGERGCLAAVYRMAGYM